MMFQTLPVILSVDFLLASSNSLAKSISLKGRPLSAWSCPDIFSVGVCNVLELLVALPLPALDVGATGTGTSASGTFGADAPVEG